MNLPARLKSWVSGSPVIEETLRLAMSGQASRRGSTVRNMGEAVGIPAVMQSVRLIAETAAMMPTILYSEDANGVRSRATGDKRYDLLHNRPGPGYTWVDWRSDVFTSLLGYGNAYIRKVKSSQRERGILALVVLDPRTVAPAWDGYEIKYSVAGEDMTRDDLIHVRGLTLHGEPYGLSPITAARLALGSGMAIEDFLNATFANDATPGGILNVPGTLTREKARDHLDIWNEQHQGAKHRGKAAVLGGGITWQSVGMSMVDAQFVEAQRTTVAQSARIFNIPAPLLGIGVRDATREHWEQLVRGTCGPHVARLDAALTADIDLCPPGSRNTVESLTDALLKPGTLERYEAYKAARQGGWTTANEIRRKENLPPVDGGDEIQLTPVGGAPNAPAAAGPKDGAANA